MELPTFKSQVVTSDGKVIKGFVIDFIDEMDNDEQDEITILIDNPSPDEPTEISLFETEIKYYSRGKIKSTYDRCNLLAY